MTPARTARGFTLTELLVSMVVSAFVIAGALSLLVAQQRSFKGSAGDRALQESARAALSDIGMNLRRAGYGVEPWLAFDFGPPTNAPGTLQSYQSGLPGGTRVACTGSGLVACRDSTTGPDEIVFHARSPAFSRRLSAVPSSTTLAFTAALTTPLSTGQILQVMCAGAADWAYVTVASTATDNLSVTLDGTVTSGAIPFQQAKLASGCFAALDASSHPTALVFRIDRFHYFVSTYADPDHPAGRPYLMLDRGLSAGGVPIVEPVAPDVEDLQFAYVFKATTGGPIVGSVAGTQLGNATASIDLAAKPPSYDADTSDPARNTNSPANIRAVQVSVVVRTPSYDAALTATADRTLPAAANRAANTAGPVGYRRVLVQTTQATRNLDSRGAFMPPLSIVSTDGLNVGGG